MTRSSKEEVLSLVISEHGIDYDFTEFMELGEITRLAAESFKNSLSNSSFERSAKRTNKTQYTQMRVWLKFAQKCARDGKAIAYDLPTYLLFEHFIKSNYRPTTEITTLIAARRLFRFGAFHSKLPRIAFPRPTSQRLALATSSTLR